MHGDGGCGCEKTCGSNTELEVAENSEMKFCKFFETVRISSALPFLYFLRSTSRLNVRSSFHHFFAAVLRTLWPTINYCCLRGKKCSSSSLHLAILKYPRDFL